MNLYPIGTSVQIRSIAGWRSLRFILAGIFGALIYS
jgi:hypothetical protein